MLTCARRSTLVCVKMCSRQAGTPAVLSPLQTDSCLDLAEGPDAVCRFDTGEQARITVNSQYSTKVSRQANQCWDRYVLRKKRSYAFSPKSRKGTTLKQTIPGGSFGPFTPSGGSSSTMHLGSSGSFTFLSAFLQSLKSAFMCGLHTDTV